MSAPSGLFPGRWWTKSDDRFVCELCPRNCHLKPGQRGFCYVRIADEQSVQLATYGRSSGFCIDPIEKKPLAHFLPGTPVLSFGTAGCNLGCRFCQNHDISKARADDTMMANAMPEQIAEAAVRSGSRSVAMTYNDPVIWSEYAIDTAIACHERGIRTVAVTAGYIGAEARPDFFRHMDATNVDLKAFTERFYKQLCFAELEPVKDTLRWLVHESSTWTEITTLLIPEENDSESEIRRLCSFVRDELSPDVPLHFTAYHPDFKLDRPATPPATVIQARRIAMDEGLRFVYTGNVYDPAGQATICPGCGLKVVERNGYVIDAWRVRGSACAACGHAIPGVFEDEHGTWGSRRQPVRVGAW